MSELLLLWTKTTTKAKSLVVTDNYSESDICSLHLKKSLTAWAKMFSQLVPVQPIKQDSFAHTTNKIMKRSF